MIAKDCMSQQFSSPVPEQFLRAEPAIRGQGQSWETCAASIGKGSDRFGGRYDNTEIKGKILGE